MASFKLLSVGLMPPESFLGSAGSQPFLSAVSSDSQYSRDNLRYVCVIERRRESEKEHVPEIPILVMTLEAPKRRNRLPIWSRAMILCVKGEFVAVVA